MCSADVCGRRRRLKHHFVTITTESAPNSIRFSDVHPTSRLSRYRYYSHSHRCVILGMGLDRDCSVPAPNRIFKDAHCYDRQSSFSVSFRTRPIGVEKSILVFSTSQHSHMPRSGLTLIPGTFSTNLRRYNCMFYLFSQQLFQLRGDPLEGSQRGLYVT